MSRKMSSEERDLIAKSMFGEVIPMKVMDRNDHAAMRAYLSRPPEQTHTKAELEAVYRAVRFTKLFKQAESLAKMDEEEAIERPLITPSNMFTLPSKKS